MDKMCFSAIICFIVFFSDFFIPVWATPTCSRHGIITPGRLSHRFKCCAGNDGIYRVMDNHSGFKCCPGVGTFLNRHKFCYDNGGVVELRDRFAREERVCEKNSTMVNPYDGTKYECCVQDGDLYGVRYNKEIGCECQGSDYLPIFFSNGGKNSEKAGNQRSCGAFVYMGDLKKITKRKFILTNASYFQRKTSMQSGNMKKLTVKYSLKTKIKHVRRGCMVVIFTQNQIKKDNQLVLNKKSDLVIPRC